MDDDEMGWIEIDALALRRATEYAAELHRIKEGVRAVIAELEALDYPGTSVLAQQLREITDPLQYLQSALTIEDNDNTSTEGRQS